jgi:hypothetical protein
VALRLPPLYLPADRVHIFSGDEFIRVFAEHAGSLGLSLGTHAYIPRSGDRVRFASSVTHELVHLSCFKRYRVEAEIEERDEDNSLTGGVTIEPTRMGLRLGKDSFEGLNEAVTEIFATAVRERFTEMRSPLTKKEVNELIEWSAYVPQIKLFEALTEKVWGDVVPGFTIALWDYMTGTNCFLRDLNRALPDAVGILRCMGVKPQSALDTARKLDLKKLINELVGLVKDE